MLVCVCDRWQTTQQQTVDRCVPLSGAISPNRLPDLTSLPTHLVSSQTGTTTTTATLYSDVWYSSSSSRCSAVVQQMLLWMAVPGHCRYRLSALYRVEL